MVEHQTFDHVAFAVHRWVDGFPALAGELGGRWHRGGVTEAFSPGQLEFAGGMLVELLQPGTSTDGFLARFLATRGPAPHHLTFKVADLDAFVAGCRLLDVDVMPGQIDAPGRREAFVHPRASGLGTLLQAIEEDDRYAARTEAPADFPTTSAPQHAIAWVALAVPDVRRALELFVRVLAGTPHGRGEDSNPSSALLEWGAARRLLLLDAALAAALRPGAELGVHHVAFTGAPAPPPPLHAIGTAEEVAGAGLGVPILVL